MGNPVYHYRTPKVKLIQIPAKRSICQTSADALEIYGAYCLDDDFATDADPVSKVMNYLEK